MLHTSWERRKFYYYILVRHIAPLECGGGEGEDSFLPLECGRLGRLLGNIKFNFNYIKASVKGGYAIILVPGKR